MSRPVQRLKFYDRVSSRPHFSRQPRASPWEQNTLQATILAVLSATPKLELRGDIPASHMGSRSTTPLLRNPTEVRHCSQHAGANVDFGDEGAVDWAFLGNLKQLRALLLG